MRQNTSSVHPPFPQDVMCSTTVKKCSDKILVEVFFQK